MSTDPQYEHISSHSEKCLSGPMPTLHPQYLHHQQRHLQIPLQHQQQGRLQSENAQENNNELYRGVDGLLCINRAADLVVHGSIVVVSAYAFGSAISIALFESNHKYTPATAFFLFLVMDLSFVTASIYARLGWWGRTPAGMEQFRKCMQARLPTSDGADLKAQQQPKAYKWTVSSAVFLIADKPRLWIQTGVAALCFLAASMQWYKFQNAYKCKGPPVAFQFPCSTAKGAIASTFLVGFMWTAWFGWWLYQVRRYKQTIVMPSGHDKIEQGQQGDIWISMPDDRNNVGRMREGSSLSQDIVNPSEKTQSACQLNPSQKYQASQARASPSPLSTKNKTRQSIASGTSTESTLGLGIGIYGESIIDGIDLSLTQTENNQYNSNSSGSNNSQDSSDDDIIAMKMNPSDTATATRAIPGDSMREATGYNSSIGHIKHHVYSTSLSNINHVCSLEPGISPSDAGHVGRARRNSISSVRLRDHARIFNDSNSNIHGGYCNRGTPLIHSGSCDIIGGRGLSWNRPINSSKSLSPGSTTPTTPLSRGEMGYLGAGTMRVLNNASRSVSMGHIAAFNNMNANGSTMASVTITGSVASSPHGSPAFDLPVTSGSTRSHQPTSSFSGSNSSGGRSLSYYPSSLAEAETAEQSMDEHLKAIRRRSFIADLESTSKDLMSITDSMFAPGSPVSAAPARTGSFRMSFSSPNLTAYRRRSSLGMISVLNPLVTSLVGSDASSTPSSNASSSCSITDSGNLNESKDDILSFDLKQRCAQAVSAEELLRSEYGDLYFSLPKSRSDILVNSPLESSNPSLGFNSATTATGLPLNLILSRSRSHSASSASTSRTNSSGESDSSHLTSLSNEKSRAIPQHMRPPRIVLNRVLIGGCAAQTKDEKLQQHLQKKPQQPQQQEDRQGVLH
ncbi:hypothetical protein BX616_010336 [Lobosporangium transversale]|uniref:Uncharacterized protein n=1 Tax=Lobosporangium transversale TaxID=64571 RepID=A0A1Y2GI02_9FUNG|nr:hypothetical protein BCR41DRAFT_398020 [Lobosporangium transversale]KAF9912327.1 hypothetical protein BX616_010336 [Lobosporangium transversale]ORZ11351.1 hypothetical protein BCR41DRAFT_398020 [Lobosporangium transversale]|eukprot:XP_021879666.1 hypothetical protein BCR41DRAFT_398020 [Lobosporangium transversale]